MTYIYILLMYCQIFLPNIWILKNLLNHLIVHQKLLLVLLMNTLHSLLVVSQGSYTWVITLRLIDNYLVVIDPVLILLTTTGHHILVKLSIINIFDLLIVIWMALIRSHLLLILIDIILIMFSIRLSILTVHLLLMQCLSLSILSLLIIAVVVDLLLLIIYACLVDFFNLLFLAHLTEVASIYFRVSWLFTNRLLDLLRNTTALGVLNDSRLLFTWNLMLIFEIRTKLLLSLHFVVHSISTFWKLN